MTPAVSHLKQRITTDCRIAPEIDPLIALKIDPLETAYLSDHYRILAFQVGQCETQTSQKIGSIFNANQHLAHARTTLLTSRQFEENSGDLLFGIPRMTAYPISFRLGYDKAGGRYFLRSQSGRSRYIKFGQLS